MMRWDLFWGCKVGSKIGTIFAKEHMCIYAKPMGADSNAVKARVGGGAWWRGEGRQMGGICNTVNNKEK